METSTPIRTPIVRENQVGSLLRIFWFILDFIITTFTNPKGTEATLKGEFVDKGMQFSVKTGLNVRFLYSLMVIV